MTRMRKGKKILMSNAEGRYLLPCFSVNHLPSFTGSISTTFIVGARPQKDRAYHLRHRAHDNLVVRCGLAGKSASWTRSMFAVCVIVCIVQRSSVVLLLLAVTWDFKRLGRGGF